MHLRKSAIPRIKNVISLKVDDDNNDRTALKWIPEGKLKQGQPKTTWTRNVEGELCEGRKYHGKKVDHLRQLF